MKQCKLLTLTEVWQIMYRYAQTNVQLFNQLRIDGYSDTECSLIYEAYEMAKQLFAGQYRASIGKTLIAHLVGTASIMSSLHFPIEIVAGGLLHAAYADGDFGNKEKGLLDVNRKQIRDIVGERVEEYIAKYTALGWQGDEEISILHKEIDALDGIERDLLLMRLVNELEEYLDHCIIYCSEKKRKKRIKRIKRDSHLMVGAAQKLGFPTLAAELSDVFEEALQTPEAIS
jgi:hypothetical protein